MPCKNYICTENNDHITYLQSKLSKLSKKTSLLN